MNKLFSLIRLAIHKPHNALGDYMVESAYSTLREVDTVLFMVPADEPRGKG